MALSSFSLPRSIVYGDSALKMLATLKGRRAAIVTGVGSMKRAGVLDTATADLKEAGMECLVIEGVEPDPSMPTVQRGAAAMADFGPDWIVAIGGGSAIDAAKIMWCFYEHPELSFEEMRKPGSIPGLRNKARLVAVPSTSGTASEIAALSVITDAEGHIKYPILSTELIPDLAILDPALPATMPPELTAHTGMDVLAHAIEALASTAASAFTDPYAVQAVKLVLANLPRAHDHGGDAAARLNMHLASTLAGIAFTNASLGLGHSLAHKIGGEFGMTHGLANAILLPYIIDFNRTSSPKYRLLEKELSVRNIAAEVRKLNAKLGIPEAIKDCHDVDCTEEKFQMVLDRMSVHAFADPFTLTNPGQPTVNDVRAIYRAAYFGNSMK